MTQDMKTYIGTRIIQAKRSPDGLHGYDVEYSDGYKSWSPAKAFEKVYRRTDAMTFGDALVMLKAEKRVARAGWNGKAMWLSLVRRSDWDTCQFDPAELLPFIAMKTADNKFVPWLASQTDMLAEDWCVVEG